LFQINRGTWRSHVFKEKLTQFAPRNDFSKLKELWVSLGNHALSPISLRKHISLGNLGPFALGNHVLGPFSLRTHVLERITEPFPKMNDDFFFSNESQP